MLRTRQTSSSISVLPRNPSYHLILPKNPQIRNTKNSESTLNFRLLKKSSELHNPDHSAINKTDIPRFIPKSRYYVQLSPPQSDYDLKGKSTASDKKSLEKILNYEQVLRKASDIQTQLRGFKLKSARKSMMKKIESLKTPQNDAKFQKSDNFLKEVKTGNVETVQEMLQGDAMLIYSVDATRQTALHWACRRGYTELVKVLVGFKASSMVADMVGRTPEDIARSKNCYEIIDFFTRQKRIQRQTSRLFNSIYKD